MTLVGTLWGVLYQRQTKVILSVAALNGLELEQPPFSFTDRPPEFTAKFPYGKIPAFEGTDGSKLIEGAPIARYLSSIGTKVDLLGASPYDAAIVDQWVHFAEHEVIPPTQTIRRLVHGFYGSINVETIGKATEALTRALDYLEAHLAARPSGYVALDGLTLADLVVAGVVYTAARSSLGAAERARYTHIFAHYARVTEDERVKQYWGTDGFVEVSIAESKTVETS